MGEYIAVPDWVKPGADIAVTRGAGGGYYRDTVERLTPTQVILASGERYHRKGLSAIKRGHWGAGTLVPANHPGVIEQDENGAVDGMWPRLQKAMVTWRQNEKKGEEARAKALRQVRAALANAEEELYRLHAIDPYEEKS